MSRARWLNGWHRLFVVLAVGYGMLVLGGTAVAYYSAKQHVEYKARAERAHAQQTMDALRQRYGLPTAAAPSTGRDWSRELFGSQDSTPPVAIGRSLAFEFTDSVTDANPPWFALIQPLLWPAFLFWMIPIIILYALGWSVAWIRRGFVVPRD